MIQTVGFYGHSDCAYRGADSHIDMVAQSLNAQIVNTGVRQGSEERILYELKKTKNLDLAIIFHSEPQYLFLPGCDRDIGLNHLREHRAEYLFENWGSDYFKTYHHRFLEKFGDPEKFMMAISAYKYYFYDPDLQANRFYGALIQIDQYLTHKNIPAIHVTNSSIPPWFKFTGGVIDGEISTIIKQNRAPRGEYSVNGITVSGNRLVAERITGIVENLGSSSPAVVAQR